MHTDDIVDMAMGCMKVAKLVAWLRVMVENKSGSNVQPKGPNPKENAVRCKANPKKMNERDAVKSPDSKCCVMLADVVEDLLILSFL